MFMNNRVALTHIMTDRNTVTCHASKGKKRWAKKILVEKYRKVVVKLVVISF